MITETLGELHLPERDPRSSQLILKVTTYNSENPVEMCSTAPTD